MIKHSLAKAALLAILSITSFGAGAQDAGGGQNGNGGGGVLKNGRYMTFYSAGLFVDSGELTTDDLPALKYLADFVMTDPYLNSSISTRFARAIAPSAARKYFKVQNEKFTPEIRNRLLAEYGRIAQVNVAALALFAITDTHTQTTYLLPGFYQLNSVEQLAILFHEAYWILYPKSTYEQVVSVEVAFQKYLENRHSPEAMIAWLSKIASSDELISAAKMSDSKTGALSSISKDQRLPARTLLGGAAIQCYLNNGRTADFVEHGWDDNNACGTLVYKNLYVLAAQYPKSMLLKGLVYLVNSGKTLSVRSDSAARCSGGGTQNLGVYIRIDEKLSFIQLDSLESGLSFYVKQIAKGRCIADDTFAGRPNFITIN